MKDKDFQSRLVGIALGALIFWLFIVVAVWAVDWVMGHADSGPMYQPSEWKR